MRLFQLTLILLFSAVSGWTHPTYTGYSGAPGRQTCASSCHGSSGGTITITGFPTSYAPGQAYTLTIGHSAGTTIANFNASCRVGSGNTNAGTLAAGTATATYSVSGETNGVHFYSTNQNSGTFTWTAPAAGTGTVHLYVGGHQGTASGVNTAAVLTANETASVPGEASNPAPADNAESVEINTGLSWTAGGGATSHEVFLGTTNPPDSVGNVTSAAYTPASSLTPGATYYWQIRERNAAGVTAGPVWQFSTLALPTVASNPSPADGDSDITVRVTLAWLAGSATSAHDVYLGMMNPPPQVMAGQSGSTYTPSQNLMEGTLYYWRVDEVNSSGTTQGPVWSFRTESANGVGTPSVLIPTELKLGPAYPNPFNATVTIPFALPQSASVTVSLYDVTGRLAATLLSGNYAAGVHSVQWSSEGVASGVYLLRLNAGGKVLTAKVVALK